MNLFINTIDDAFIGKKKDRISDDNENEQDRKSESNGKNNNDNNNDDNDTDNNKDEQIVASYLGYVPVIGEIVLVKLD